MVRWIIGTMVCIALAAAATWVQKSQVHPRSNRGLDEDLLYLPNENLVTHFTAGLSGVLADLLWIQTINYASEEFNSPDKKFTWLEHMVRTVTRMDPYYEDAYVNGGMMLSALGQDDRSLPLLQEGLIALPNSTRIPQELVTIYLLNRRKEPGAAAMTLQYMNILAKNSEYPQQYIEWMDRIRASNSLEGEARRVWTDLIESSSDEFVRELARAQLAALDADIVLQALKAAAADYEQAKGDSPPTVEALLEFLGGDAPVLREELGGFYIAHDGAVRSSLLDTRMTDRHKRILATRIASFENRNGAFPESLEALKENGPRVNIEHPVPGYQWKYDPATGEITDEPVQIANE